MLISGMEQGKNSKLPTLTQAEEKAYVPEHFI